MSAFQVLRNVCNNFEGELRKVSGELSSVNVGESFEDVVSKKTSALSLLTAKLRLLEAKKFSVTPQITQKEKGEDTIKEYEDSVVKKILEQTTVKSLTQMNAVQALITAPDSSLHPELVDRKRKIMESLENFRQKESELRQLDAVRREKEIEYESVRMQWEKEPMEMCERRNSIEGDIEMSGPMYMKLAMLVSKLEMMRWLLGKLVLSRTPRYDWLADPCRRVNILAITRQHNTVEMFTDKAYD